MLGWVTLELNGLNLVGSGQVRSAAIKPHWRKTWGAQTYRHTDGKGKINNYLDLFIFLFLLI